MKEKTEMEINIKIEKLPKSKIKISSTVSANDLESYYQKSLEKIVEQAELPGFRKGKAPKEMVEKQVGQDHILDEAAELAMNEAYIKAIREHKLDLIGDPAANIKKLARGNELEFEIESHVLPEIKLPDFKKIASKSKLATVDVTDKELEDSIKWLQNSLARFTEKIGTADEGDWVQISVSLNDEKEAKDGFVLGKGGLLKDIEDQIKGMTKGETKEFTFKFKNGEDAKCKVTLNDLKSVATPEANDEFAQSVGPYKGLAELKEEIHNDLLKNKKNAELEKTVSEVLTEISKEVDLEIPDILITREMAAQLEDMKKRVTQEGEMTFEEYLEKVKKTEQEILESMRPGTEKKVKEYFILKEIQKAENITATDDEIQAELMKVYARYPELESQTSVDRQNLIEYTKDRIESDKTFKKFEEYLGK